MSSDSLLIESPNYEKWIDVNSSGSFRDTLHVETGIYALVIGDKRGEIFLKDGFDLNLEVDESDLKNSIRFNGCGEEENNFIAKKIRFIEYEMGQPRDYYRLQREDFLEKLQWLENSLDGLLENRFMMDPEFVQREESLHFEWVNHLFVNYDDMHPRYAKLEPGNDTPLFENYITIDGDQVSLDDLNGDPLYIQVWNTECEICMEEIQQLPDLLEKYGESGLRVVHISIDRPGELDRWRDVVRELPERGTHLNTGNGIMSRFMIDYEITEPGRYILLNSDGTILNAFAPPPSDPGLLELLDSVM